MPKKPTLPAIDRTLPVGAPAVSPMTLAILEATKPRTSPPKAAAPEFAAERTSADEPCLGLQQCRQALGGFLRSGEIGGPLLAVIYQQEAFLPVEVCSSTTSATYQPIDSRSES